MLGYTGIRFGEATALRVSDFDALRRRLAISRSLAEVNGQLIVGTPKTHQSRDVAVPRFLVDDLAVLVAGRDRGAPIFTTLRGMPIRLSNWRQRVFYPARDDAGLDDAVTPHHLRHTAASLLIRSGASIKFVQQQMGHASATVTLDRYGHLYGDELDSVADALDGIARAAGSGKRAANARITTLESAPARS